MRTRRTLLVAATAALIAAALPSRFGAAGQAAPAAADTGALGFLRTVVDRRLYSLEGAGVARLAGTAHATFEVIVPDPTLRPTAVDLELLCDFASGLVAARPAKPPAGDQVPIAPMAINAAQYAFSMLPSRAATGWTTALAQDGELFRIDYKPPTSTDPAGAGAAGGSEPAAGHWSEWHRADGTPVRRRVTSYRPAGATAELFTQEILPTYEERGGKLLLTTLKPGDTQGRFTHEFEYVEKDGLYLLKKVVQTDQGWRLTLEFTLAAERPAAK